MATLPPPTPYSRREAAEAQRYYRRSLRRPSMVGPMVLIVVGVIALLVEIGKLNAYHVWEWYIRWWPLLLIGVGLLSLGEWWLDRNHGPRADARRSHGGLIALDYLPGRTRATWWASTTHAACMACISVRAWQLSTKTFFSHLLGAGARCRPQPQPGDSRRGGGRHPGTSHGDVTVTLSGDDQVHVASAPGGLRLE